MLCTTITPATTLQSTQSNQPACQPPNKHSNKYNNNNINSCCYYLLLLLCLLLFGGLVSCVCLSSRHCFISDHECGKLDFQFRLHFALVSLLRFTFTWTWCGVGFSSNKHQIIFLSLYYHFDWILPLIIMNRKQRKHLLIRLSVSCTFVNWLVGWLRRLHNTLWQNVNLREFPVLTWLLQYFWWTLRWTFFLGIVELISSIVFGWNFSCDLGFNYTAILNKTIV